MPANGSGEHDAFQIAPLLDQVFELIAVRDAGDVLLDDRSVVENLGYVVAGRADQLDAAANA